MARKYAQQRNELAVKLTRELYRGIDGRELSLQGRKKRNDHESLTYGEIVPQSFIQILLSIMSISPSPLLPPPPATTTTSATGKVFVDLGCGVGVAVMTAALSACNFTKVWGIELLPELLEAANSIPDLLLNLLEQSKIQSTSQKLSEETTSKTTSKTKPPITSNTSSEEFRLHHEIESIFQSTQMNTMAIEMLVDQICRKVGHKDYKKMLKGSKSFKKFLSLHPSRYAIEGDQVGLVVPPSNSLPVIPQNDSEQTDQDSPDDATFPHSEIRRQTRPEIILHLLNSPTGQLICQEGSLPMIQFECHDIFQVNWWDEGDVVYCASLLFSDEMMSRLLDRVWEMKSYSFFISLKPLPFPERGQIQQGDVISQHEDEFNREGGRGRELRLVSDSFYRMSWQMARVYVYQLGPRVV